MQAIAADRAALAPKLSSERALAHAEGDAESGAATSSLVSTGHTYTWEIAVG
jgi:hypothetical protein